MVTKFFAANPVIALPSVAKAGDAGIDLRYNGERSFMMELNTVYKIPTGVHVEIPPGKCGIIFERSGLGAKFGATVHGRIIDSGYRGEVVVLMSRTCGYICDVKDMEKRTDTLIINPGDRVAQMVIVEFSASLLQVAALADLSSSERGVAGLGSTGVK